MPSKSRRILTSPAERPSFGRNLRTFYSAEDAGTSTPASASISPDSEEKKGRKRKYDDTETSGKRRRTSLSPGEDYSYQATPETNRKATLAATRKATRKATAAAIRKANRKATRKATPAAPPADNPEAIPVTTFRYGSDTFFTENSRGTFYSAEDAGTSTPASASINPESEEKKGRKRKADDTETSGKRRRTSLSPGEDCSYQATPEATRKANRKATAAANRKATAAANRKANRKATRKATPAAPPLTTSEAITVTTSESIPVTTSESIPVTTFRFGSDTIFSVNRRRNCYSTGDAGTLTPASASNSPRVEEKRGRKRKSEGTEAFGRRRRPFLNPGEGTSFQATTQATTQAPPEASFRYESDTFFSENNRRNFYFTEDAVSPIPASASASASASISTDSEEKKGRKRKCEDTEASGKRRKTSLSPREDCIYQATTEATPKATRKATPKATRKATPWATRKATPKATRKATPWATRKATPETSFGNGSDTFFSENSRGIVYAEDVVSGVDASASICTDSEEKKGRKRKGEDLESSGKRRKMSLSSGEGCSHQATTEATRKAPRKATPWATRKATPETSPAATPAATRKATRKATPWATRKATPKATPETCPQFEASSGNESDTAFPEATLFHSRADFEAKYKEETELGEGGFGTVFAGYRKADHLPVATKHIRRFQNTKVNLDGEITVIPMEVALLLKLRPTQAVVSLLDWYNLSDELILVLERPVPCKDLYDYIQSKEYPMEEDVARVITKELVDGLKEVHSRGVFHRDIKVENILIETGSDVPRARIIDFGCGAFVTETYTKNRGTPMYTTPEYYQHRWSTPEATTVWQLGVMLFEMLHEGQLPFLSRYEISDEAPNIRGAVSPDCLDFLKRCLDKSPESRPTLETLQHHPWLT